MLNSGDVFAGYTVERLLGQGGMGSVYLARHPRFSRQTALKLLNPDLYTDNEVRARFEREADLAAQLDHPSIVTVYDRGSENGQLWIAMQYIDGVDAASVNPMTLPPERAVQIIEGVAAALDYAHGMGVLHRDVKPANIMLARSSGGQGERVFLTDFGIARLREDSTHLTQTGMFTATLAYASPEQMTGGHLDPRTDQYALACTLYWLLAGVGPFDADNPADIIRGHLQLALPPLAVRRRGLNPAMDAVLAAGMAKRPEHRYNTCAEFAAAAKHALTTTSGPRLPSPPPGAVVRADQTFPSMPPGAYPAPAQQFPPAPGPPGYQAVPQNPAPGYPVPPQNPAPAYPAASQSPAPAHPAPQHGTSESGPAAETKEGRAEWSEHASPPAAQAGSADTGAVTVGDQPVPRGDESAQPAAAGAVGVDLVEGQANSVAPGYPPPVAADSTPRTTSRATGVLIGVLAVGVVAIVVAAVALIAVVLIGSEPSDTAASPATSSLRSVTPSGAPDPVTASVRAFPRLLPPGGVDWGEGYQDAECAAYRQGEGFEPKDAPLRSSSWVIAWQCDRDVDDQSHMSYTILGYDSPAAARATVAALPSNTETPGLKNGVRHTRHGWIVPDPPGPLQPYFYTAKMVVSFEDDPARAGYLLYVSHQGTSKNPQSLQPSADANIAEWWSAAPL
ncbi:protein kinase [Nocardia sp. NPDC005366]|uniref:serine/threonine-protein kinase n=1 Tax=Nocardia sp. NPDC005366 TaxID=3156878 RepID=UPI0033A76365